MREAARRDQVHLLGEELVVGAPHLLGVVHRRVGVADQRLGVAAVVGEHADADRGRDGELALLHRHRLRQLVDDLLRHLRDVRGALHLGQHHHELVAADAADGVADAQLLHQAQRHFLQQHVADGVAERVVDGLEAVEVDEHHRGLLAVAVGQRERLLQAVLQQAPVGQAGERVVVGEVLGARVGLLQLDGALGDRALERVARGLGQRPRLVLGGDVLVAPDPLLLLVAGVDAAAARAADEGAAVAAPERRLVLVGAARRGVAVGAPAGRLPLLLAGEQHRAALPDQLAGPGADHVLEEAVAALDDAGAHEGDADRGVVEDQLLLGEGALHALLGGALLRDVGEQPDVAALGPAGLHRAPADAAPEARAVLAAQVLLARVRHAAVEVLVDLPDLAELLLGEVVVARRAADDLARRVAEQLLVAPVAAHRLALAAEGDADRDVVDQRLLLGQHALQLLLGVALLGDVLHRPYRAALRVLRVDRAAVDARPEHGAVLAPALLDAPRGAAAREVGIGRLGGRMQVRVGVQQHGRLAVELARLVAVHLLVAPVAAHDPAVLDEHHADRRGAEDRLLLAQQARRLVGVAPALGDVLDDPHRALLHVGLAHRARDDARDEGGAVLAAELPLEVELAAAGEDRHGDAAERLVALGRGVDHAAFLADQLVRRVAEHLGELRVAEEEAPLAGEGDAERGVGEDRLELGLRVARAPGVARRRLLQGERAASRDGRIVHWARPARTAKSSA